MGADVYAQSLVDNLLKYSKVAGTDISFDLHFTSVVFAQWRLKKQISTVGTVTTNTTNIKGIIKEMKDLINQKKKSITLFSLISL